MAPRRPKTTSTTASRIGAALRKKFGNDAALVVSDEVKAISEVKERLSTGIDVLDHYVLGKGGLPVGRSSEWFGANNVGKTSLAFRMLAASQKQGAICVYADVEQSFEEDRARTMGVNIDALLIIQPYSLEQLMEEIKYTLSLHKPAEGPMLIIWDSVASAITETEHKKEAGKAKVGDVPQVLSKELKKIAAMLPRQRAHFAMLNQIRANIGVMYGDNTTTPGGNAPKFYASQRVQLMGGKAVKNSKEEHVAKIITAIAVKNRLGAPWRKAKIRLDYTDIGFNNVWSTVWHAKRMKLMTPREKDYAGPSKEGLLAYAEAIDVLDWPEPAEMPKMVSSAAAPDDSEEEQGDDADNDDEE